MDLSSRLRAIARGNRTAKPVGLAPSAIAQELTYEPDTGRFEASPDLDRVAEILGGRRLATSSGHCIAVDRRYESDRWHGDMRIGDCDLDDRRSLRLLDPSLSLRPTHTSATEPRTIFVDLETTGLSGGAGTVAFLVGCGYFDVGAFQVRQFLLTSFASERALLSAVAEFFGGADLIVTYNGKTFDVPVMETRWLFHRLPMPLDGVPHFDMLHPARRLWRSRGPVETWADEGGCRLTSLERMLMNVRRVGEVAAFEIPRRFFQFLRTGDARPLEPVLEHNRLDLVSLAAVTGHALRLARSGDVACRDEAEALALGRLLERAEVLDRAEACYRRAADSACVEVRAEALYRLGLRYRRDRRFLEAADVWRTIVGLTEPSTRRRQRSLEQIRHFALEALAIHQEHRAKDLDAARHLALFALDEDVTPARADGFKYRLARLDRKLATKRNALLFS